MKSVTNSSAATVQQQRTSVFCCLKTQQEPASSRLGLLLCPDGAFSLASIPIWNICFGFHEKHLFGSQSQYYWIVLESQVSYLFLLLDTHQGIFSEGWQRWRHSQGACLWCLDSPFHVNADGISMVWSSKRVSGCFRQHQTVRSKSQIWLSWLEGVHAITTECLTRYSVLHTVKSTHSSRVKFTVCWFTMCQFTVWWFTVGSLCVDSVSTDSLCANDSLCADSLCADSLCVNSLYANSMYQIHCALIHYLQIHHHCWFTPADSLSAADLLCADLLCADSQTADSLCTGW